MRHEMLGEAMESLNDREKHILTERRLTENPQTLEELSQVYSVSRERIRQIEVRAFEKLQKAMKAIAGLDKDPDPKRVAIACKRYVTRHLTGASLAVGDARLSLPDQVIDPVSVDSHALLDVGVTHSLQILQHQYLSHLGGEFHQRFG